jgi:hypothetical protein
MVGDREDVRREGGVVALTLRSHAKHGVSKGEGVHAEFAAILRDGRCAPSSG